MFKKIALTMAIGIISLGSYSFSFAENVTSSSDIKVETSKKTIPTSTDLIPLNAVSKQITTYFGADIVNYVSESEIPNVYLVTLNDGTNMMYFKDTKFAVVGDMYDLEQKKNITRSLLSEYNASILKDLQKEGIEYPATATDKPVETLYVFTDPTCGYCRKLNHERASYAENGIKLVYLPYSRSGENTFSYNELVDVWCSGDKQTAMDLAKTDKGADIKTMPNYKVTDECKAEVKKAQEAGRRLGMSGTPALFTADGHFFPGYIEAGKLREFISKARE